MYIVILWLIAYYILKKNMKKILFVCLGNICRSPMGEGMFQHLVDEKGLSNDYSIDSAGTSAYHVGELADERMRQTASSHGLELKSRARQAIASDFDNFDIIIAMDESNYKNLENLAISNGKTAKNLKLMRDFDSIQDDMNVPDPYYGGQDGFENVYQMMYRCCNSLLDNLERE